MKLMQPLALPDLSKEDAAVRDVFMLRVTLVWTDPPGVQMINKLKLGLVYTGKDGSAVAKDPDPVSPMW
jgi:hypothetical protein